MAVRRDFDKISLKRRTSKRGSRPQVFYKRAALKNFPKFTKKYLRPNLFINSTTAGPAALLKKRF